ncbi:MAG: hypothetical protein R2836_05705 [Chitinophagales bacterium]
MQFISSTGEIKDKQSIYVKPIKIRKYLYFVQKLTGITPAIIEERGNGF